ncbi:MAG: molybdopterin-dependent oxidoreductase, partial [Candidatus Bathyarchaeia archaeon]
ENVLLAYKLNGKWLEESLGAPLRLVVPHKYAYKSAMWIERISFTKTNELGFWEKEDTATRRTSGRTTDSEGRNPFLSVFRERKI